MKAENTQFKMNQNKRYALILFIILFIFTLFLLYLIKINDYSSSLVEDILLFLSGVTAALMIPSFQAVLQNNNSSKNVRKRNYPSSGFRSNKEEAIKPSKQDISYNDARKLIEAQEVESDGVLATSSTVIGVISLEVFARRHKPDLIVGVNRGGWLLSAYLAHRLNIGRNNLVRFDADREDTIEATFDSTNEPGVNILLVDDISRTGDSIRKAIACIKNKYPSSNVSVAVLVVCDRKKDENIDYNPYWTQYKDIQLPWSSDERKKEARRLINAQGEVVRIGDDNSLDRKVSILRIADDHTKEGEEFDISNNDIETVIRMLENLIPIPETTSTHKDLKAS